MVRAKVISGCPPGLVYFTVLLYSVLVGVAGTVGLGVDAGVEVVVFGGVGVVAFGVDGVDGFGGVGVVGVVGFGVGAGAGVASFGAIPLANCRNAAEVREAQPTVPIESHFAFFPTTAPDILSEKRLINIELVSSPLALEAFAQVTTPSAPYQREKVADAVPPGVV